MDNKTKIGQRLRVLRSDRDCTQQKLANRTGLTRHAVAQVERGERHLKAGELRECANALNAPYEALLEGPTDRPSTEQSLDCPQLSELGLSDEQQKTLNEVIADGRGLILSAGRAGSGTTTTLFACLAARMSYVPNAQHVVATSGPLEYKPFPSQGGQFKHIVHGEDDKVSDFAKALLRQDCDTLVIDEIRNSELAEQAVKAATDKLVIASLHARRADEAVERLEVFGVPEELLDNNLRIAMAQHLVPVLCEHCKRPLQDPKEMYRILKLIESTDRLDECPDRLYRRGDGCDACSDLGTSGRTILAEMLRYNIPGAHRSESKTQSRGTPEGEENTTLTRSRVAPGTLEGHAVEKIFAGVCDKMHRRGQ